MRVPGPTQPTDTTANLLMGLPAIGLPLASGRNLFRSHRLATLRGAQPWCRRDGVRPWLLGHRRPGRWPHGRYRTAAAPSAARGGGQEVAASDWDAAVGLAAAAGLTATRRPATAWEAWEGSGAGEAGRRALVEFTRKAVPT